MCGIGAILDPAGSTGPEGAQRIVEALRHRGPDGDAIRRSSNKVLVNGSPVEEHALKGEEVITVGDSVHGVRTWASPKLH